MILEAIKYIRFKDEENEWSIEGKPLDGQYNQWLTLENINLIVGKNASGKSRTIDAIRQVAELLSGNLKLNDFKTWGFGTCTYQLLFNDNGKAVEYYLDVKEGKVIQEWITIDGEEKLNRKENKLFYEEVKDFLNFQTDEGLLALSRRDIKQQPFFENLYQWGKDLTSYKFGSPLGRDRYVPDINAIKEDYDVDLTKTGDHVATVFILAQREFGSVFIDTVLRDMRAISYKIHTINISSFKYFPSAAHGLVINEEGLFIDQSEMSQGMFRALSLLIQLNYSLLKNKSTCILIDDIGEGLDFERSKALIDLIIDKVKDSLVQVIMTTNDRYVMNKIPLKYWAVIQRIPGKSLFYNYRNSKETFDEFEYTGLNNLDFLSTEFYITGFENQVQ